MSNLLKTEIQKLKDKFHKEKGLECRNNGMVLVPQESITQLCKGMGIN